MEQSDTKNLLEKETTIQGNFDTGIAETIVKEELIIEDDFNAFDEEENQDLELEESETTVVVKEELIIEDSSDAFGEKEFEEEPTAKKPKKDRKLFTCEECGRKFSVLELYQNHLEKHENIRLGKYQCTFCKEPLGGARQLRIHVRMNHRTCDEEKRICRHCGREFPYLKSFQCHVAWHKRRGLYCCKSCGENLVLLDSSENHVCNTEKPKPSKNDLRYKFHCEECGKRFIKSEYYESHREKHEHIRNGTFQCDICHEFLGGKVELQKHKRIHGGLPEYMKSCQECGKEFRTPTAYHVHVSRHRKDSRGTFQCLQCTKYFATKGRLKFHKCPSKDLPKDGENSTSCEVEKVDDAVSEESSEVKEELKLEEPTVECEPEAGDSAAEPAPSRSIDRITFQCEECSKRFTKEALYQSHLQRHENIRNGTFRCPTCGQCLGTKRDLSEHIRDKHKPIPDWMRSCSECGREFCSLNGYRAHMARHRHMRKGTYRCEACERCFLDKTKLKIHRCSAKDAN